MLLYSFVYILGLWPIISWSYHSCPHSETPPARGEGSRRRRRGLSSGRGSYFSLSPYSRACACGGRKYPLRTYPGLVPRRRRGNPVFRCSRASDNCDNSPSHSRQHIQLGFIHDCCPLRRPHVLPETTQLTESVKRSECSYDLARMGGKNETVLPDLRSRLFGFAVGVWNQVYFYPFGAV